MTKTTKLIMFGLCLLALVPLLCKSNKSQLETMLGRPLPLSVTDIHTASKDSFFARDIWISAALPSADFDQFMKDAGFSLKKDLTQYWPSAFRGPSNSGSASWWSSTPPPAGAGYWLRMGDEKYAAKYENGRLYLRYSRS